jgi:putative flippase GtrA
MKSLVNNPRERGRFLRFLLVGLIGFVVDFGVMNLVVTLLPRPTHIGSWDIPALTFAGTVSFLCAVVSNFLWNRYWTYPDSRSKPLLKQLAQFTIVSVIGLVIRIPILYYGEVLIRAALGAVPFTVPFFSSDFLAHNITLAIAVIIVLFWNFFVNRYITYNDVE